MVILGEKTRGQVFDPEVCFILPETVWLRSLRAKMEVEGLSVPGEELFTFFHKRAGTFVLGMWMPRGKPFDPKRHKGLFTQVYNQRVPFVFTAPSIQLLLRKLEPSLFTIRRLKRLEEAKANELKREREKAAFDRDELVGRYKHDLKDEHGAMLAKIGAVTACEEGLE